MTENKKTTADNLKQVDKPEIVEETTETEAPTFVKAEASPEPILETQTERPENQVDSEDLEEPEETDAEGGAATEKTTLEVQIIQLETEVNDLNDKLLRALAETENVRRRAQRDKEDAVKFGIRRLAEDMLKVSDNLGRALSSIEPERRANDSNLDSIAAGLEIVLKDLVIAFEQSGVKQIEAMGDRFNPMLHEAMFEIEDLNQPAGTIAQVMEDGFTLHGRTLRAAKVVVTKGGPKLTGAEQSEAESTEISSSRSQKNGQKSYEAKGDGSSEAGSKVDQEH
ncbi:MAG: nucleotide exchange factor GrpE [Magnetovibrio sp.]|nr:nucleotide exchange factor GrpE [Magnetovibrio sp.]|tara:strand:+ start:2259 stop:3104 length:846 start_codon:yes stop_codon:yes gene_type:complete